MSSINLNELKTVKPQAVKGDANPSIEDIDSYKYKDILLDLQYTTVTNNAANPSFFINTDLTDIRDLPEIKNSIENLLTTRPGEKLLNPSFGLDLSSYCFDPVNSVTADRIARTVLLEVPRNEPRVEIISLDVVGHQDSGTYDITFGINILDKSVGAQKIKGRLNSDGFMFED